MIRVKKDASSHNDNKVFHVRITTSSLGDHFSEISFLCRHSLFNMITAGSVQNVSSDKP